MHGRLVHRYGSWQRQSRQLWKSATRRSDHTPRLGLVRGRCAHAAVTCAGTGRAGVVQPVPDMDVAACRCFVLDRSGIFLVACPARGARVSAASRVDGFNAFARDSGDRYPGFCKEPVVLAARVRSTGQVLVSACRDVVAASAWMVRGPTRSAGRVAALRR